MYELHRLGWYSFQQLCHTILKEELGQTVQSFLETNDGGRDGAFSGVWKQKDGEELQGKFVIQCKFTAKPNSNLSLSGISDELAKAKRLVSEGRCDTYVLMTNAGISGSQDLIITKSFNEVGVKHFLILGSTWMCDLIRKNSKLRMRVPRLYGLGDLSQILDARAYSQARSLLESMSDDLAKVVVTSPYKAALDALSDNSFVLLVGEPAAGKTTIASLLAMAAIDQWKSSPLKLDDPESVKERWNPDEPSQFFWVDDAFGATQYEPSLAFGWNKIFNEVKAMIKKGAKIVMTSRDYIYRQARKDLKQGAFPLMDESQVVINVQELGIDEKKQILYNHIKLGGQDRSFKTKIKPFLEGGAHHPRFIPEVARRLSEPEFTKKLIVSEYGVSDYIAKNEQFLKDLLINMDDETNASLALIYMRNGNLESPIELDVTESNALELLGGSLNGVRISLSALEGTLVHFSKGDSSNWRFKHPTIGDAYSSILAEDPELLGIFLQGAPPEKLIRQITCGDIDYENSINISSKLFQKVIDKLDVYEKELKEKPGSMSRWSAMRSIHYFLSRQCSKEFLELYLKNHPEFIESIITPGSSLAGKSEVPLIFKLDEVNLLPKRFRDQFIALVVYRVAAGIDGFAIESPKFQHFLSADEYEKILAELKHKLIPTLADATSDLCDQAFIDQSPEEHVSDHRDFLEALEREFSDDGEVLEVVVDELQKISNWVDEQDWSEEEDEDSFNFRDTNSISEENKIPELGRPFFDDVDK